MSDRQNDLLSARFLRAVNLVEKGEKIVVDPETVPRPHIASFEEEPFYFETDESEGYRNNHRVALKVNHRIQIPTLAGLVKCCNKDRDDDRVIFEQGMWVEYLTNNMEWKVGVVNRIIKQAPDDWNFEKDGHAPENVCTVYYNVSVEGLLDKHHVRAPKEGLEYIFGKRPWVWQQMVLLRLEKRLRFDEDHEYDFLELACLEFASEYFDAWLNDERNKDFKNKYDNQPEITKFLLKDHLMSPFRRCDKITDDKNEWDFNDPETSVYTYLGIFGKLFLNCSML